MPIEPHAIIEFYVEAMEEPRASREQGRPIFVPTEMCLIRYVGDMTRTQVAPAHEKCFMAPKGDDRGHLSYAERFPDHYAAFKAGEVKMEVGTPLSMLPFMRTERIAELKAKNVTTAEGLAGLSEAAMKACGPATQGEVNQAKVWLGKSEQMAEVAKANARTAELEARLADMEAKFAAASASVAKPSTFDAMGDDELRAFLADRGITVRANAARERLIEACKAAAEDVAA